MSDESPEDILSGSFIQEMFATDGVATKAADAAFQKEQLAALLEVDPQLKADIAAIIKEELDKEAATELGR